nr:hypothetical protein [Tanacetum cinerariifolium]
MRNQDSAKWDKGQDHMVGWGKSFGIVQDHLVRNAVVRVKIPKCMSLLDAYDEPIGDLDMMEDKVDNLSPQSLGEHLKCCQAKGSKDEEKLVHLKMVVKFEVLIEKKKMCSLGLMRFDLWMWFLMIHLEELEMKKLL